jgi:hypothetical protein
MKQLVLPAMLMGLVALASAQGLDPATLLKPPADSWPTATTRDSVTVG